jgi:hypothetical protein
VSGHGEAPALPIPGLPRSKHPTIAGREDVPMTPTGPVTLAVADGMAVVTMRTRP